MTIDPGQTGSTARGTGDNLAGNADLRASQSDRKIIALKRRLVREATTAISMLENALAALWTLDVEAAAAVRAGDDTIDSEEVAIEQECLELLALRAPYARDFRLMAFVLKVTPTSSAWPTTRAPWPRSFRASAAGWAMPLRRRGPPP